MRITAVIHPLKVPAVLEIDKDRIFLEQALFENEFNDVAGFHRAMFLQEVADQIAGGARNRAEFFQSVSALAHQHEILIFDQLVVDCRRMGVFTAKLGNPLSNVGEMQRTLFALQH